MEPMEEVEMVTVECPWCDAPVALERPDALHCEGCRIEVEIDAFDLPEVALAA